MTNHESGNAQDRRYWTAGFQSSGSTSVIKRSVTKLAIIAYIHFIRILYRVFSPASGATRPRHGESGGMVVFAIGPFFSENWSMAHMEALCRADGIDAVYLFTPDTYRKIEKLHYITHSPRVAAWFGDGIARLVNAWRSIRTLKPDLIIGYHLPWNGLTTLPLAARAKCHAAYFSVGGPPELIGGGVYSEHALFSKLGKEDDYVESLLVKMVGKFDLILTMGSRSEDFFRAITNDIPVVPLAVGINDVRFATNTGHRESKQKYDIVTVGRLSAIKQMDLFLHVVAELAKRGTAIRAAIVGDGDQMDNLKALAQKLGVASSIQFLGWIDNVDDILQQSKVFVMTSSSEGLPHSLIEAMLVQVVPVVPQIGEIADLVIDDENGFMIRGHNILDYADRIQELLSNPEQLESLSVNARSAALRYTVDQRVIEWEIALGHIASDKKQTQSL